MARIYEALSGIEIRFDDPTPVLEAFISRVRGCASDKSVTEDELIKLIYGPENPILARHPLFPERGTVTRDVLDNPVYHVLTDMLSRKHIAEAEIDVESLGARFTLTVSQAAERLKISEAAVRKAIQERRLPAWRRQGTYYLDPHTLDALEVGKRGVTKIGPLQVRAGSRPGYFLLVRIAKSANPLGQGTDEQEATIERWRKVGVLMGGNGGKLRLFELEPSEKEEAISFDEYFVKGKFSVIRKVNGAANARKAWDEFQAM